MHFRCNIPILFTITQCIITDTFILKNMQQQQNNMQMHFPQVMGALLNDSHHHHSSYLHVRWVSCHFDKIAK
jgi:hypothetical protein